MVRLPGEPNLGAYDRVIDACPKHDWRAELEFDDRSATWCLTVRNAKRHGGQRVAQAFGQEPTPEVFVKLGERLAKKLRL